jgi:hypothetical protein
MGAALNLFVRMVYVAHVGSKHKSESLFQNFVTDIAEVQTLRGIVYWEGILMHILQHYQILLTLATFVNYYRRLSSLRLNNQVMWLSDRTTTPVLATRAASS